MAEEKVLSSQLIYDGRIVRLRVDVVLLHNGHETTREIIEHSECVAVIPVDAEDNILLVEQFRLPTGKELLEIPAGGIEPGEDAETTVRRELREEIGYLPKKVTRLGGFYSAPGYCTEYLHLYMATNLTPSPLYAEDTESIKPVCVPVGKITELIDSGTICDAKSIAGLLTFLKYRKS
ncbi:MAG: NUDIX hydrolase [Dehalococcoidales bacterium]|nr:NUDIX hydrolase [Dehalococcoidales bacterium]MDP6738327.1 NUDIX hydrolase [Dehalococcoidales bacterium]